jgi:hypothetical protein
LRGEPVGQHEDVEEFGDLDDADGIGTVPGHSPLRTLADRQGTRIIREQDYPP